MTCKDIDRLIPMFLDDDLDNKELADFINHIDTCPDCKEELTIQFLIREGLQRLESGNTFNLRMELEGHIKEAKKKLKFRKSLVLASLLIEFAVISLMIVTVVLALTIG